MRVAAVDMGATSIRVAVVDLAAELPRVEIVHRWFHAPETRTDGSVRWRWNDLLVNVRAGLDRALATGPLDSIGIDGWGVDYGLVGEDGRLLSDPHSYRSPRTAGWRDVTRKLGEAELYRRTGIQLMPINTIFQLAVHDRDELRLARRLVMLPELVAYELTGELASERSNAGTTGLLDLESGAWAPDLAAAVGVASDILPPVEPAGRLLGDYRGTPVSLSAAHDTACAFVASRLDSERRAFVSAGTWFLVGVERPSADVSDTARRANFSNERGATGGFRFLKNVTGFWLLERCAQLWRTTALELLERAARAPGGVPLFDVNDERLRAPDDMDESVRVVAGLKPDADQAVVSRSIVESVAAAVARVIAELTAIVEIDELVIVGGGAASPLVRASLSEQANLPVIKGEVEATALGNALVQGIGLGRFADLADARVWLGS